MKKKLLTVLGLTMIVACLGACGSNNSSKTEQTETASETTENTEQGDGEESNTNSPAIDAEELYASIISELKPGQAYAFADICSDFDALLVSEDGAFDNGDGTMAAINVKVYGLDKDGKVIEYGEENSGGTAYPMAVYDGCLMVCNNARTMMEYIDGEAFSMITKKCVEVSYDEDDKATYSYMDSDTQTDGTLDDDSMMQEMFDMYSKATVINFTVVE